MKFPWKKCKTDPVSKESELSKTLVSNLYSDINGKRNSEEERFWRKFEDKRYAIMEEKKNMIKLYGQSK